MSASKYTIFLYSSNYTIGKKPQPTKFIHNKEKNQPNPVVRDPKPAKNAIIINRAYECIARCHKTGLIKQCVTTALQRVTMHGQLDASQPIYTNSDSRVSNRFRHAMYRN
jgi:hypothetical protein